MPEISVVVPVYNAEIYLNECVESILCQTCKDIEIILVNDGSTDGSKELCERWVLKDARIKLIHQENSGVSKARNTGIEHAKGKYICFVDSDDYIGEQYCSELLKYMAEDTDMVVTGLTQFGQSGSSVLKHRLIPKCYEWNELLPVIIDDGTFSGFTIYSPCGVLYRREIIEKNKILFRENVHYNEDGLFNVEYFFHCEKKIYLNYQISSYYYRKNEQSATHTVDLFSNKYRKSMEEIEKVLESYIDKDNMDILQRQLQYRNITIDFARIRYLAKCGDKSGRILDILNSNRFVESLKYIHPNKLTTKKKIIYLLFRFRNVPLLLLCINGNSFSKRV